MHHRIQCLFLLWIVGIIAVEFPVKQNEWDYLVLAVMYPMSRCMTEIHSTINANMADRTRCVPCHQMKHGFTLHGIWPQGISNDPLAPQSQQFGEPPDVNDRQLACEMYLNKNGKKKTQLLKDMKLYWPNLITTIGQTNEKFWCHEYAKHGFDLFERDNESKLKCRHCKTDGDEIVNYFQKSIDLFKQYDVFKILREARVTLDANRGVTLRSLHKAFNSRGSQVAPAGKSHVNIEYDVTTTAGVETLYMKQMYIYLNKKGELLPFPMSQTDLTSGKKVHMPTETEYSKLKRQCQSVYDGSLRRTGAAGAAVRGRGSRAVQQSQPISE